MFRYFPLSRDLLSLSLYYSNKGILPLSLSLSLEVDMQIALCEQREVVLLPIPCLLALPGHHGAFIASAYSTDDGGHARAGAQQKPW